MEIVLEKLGKPGRYHVIILIFVAFTWFTVGMGFMAHPFYVYTPKFDCVVPVEFSNGTDGSVLVSEDQCSYSINESLKNVTRIEDCREWSYDVDEFHNNKTINTITTQWNLVCGDKPWAAHSTTIFMSGVIFGAVLFGFLADKFGRKKLLIICLYAQSPVSLAIALNPNFIGYMVLKFILGIWLQGISSMGFLLMVEFYSAEYRGFLIAAFGGIIALGHMFMVFTSYVADDWRHVQIIAALLCLLSAPYIWWIPESPRWLIVRGRKNEIINNFIRKAVWVNGLNWESIKDFCQDNLVIPVNTSETANNENMKSLIKVKSLVLRLVLSCYIWFVSALSYYIILINIGNLAGNRFVNYAIGSTIDILNTPLVTYLLIRHRRKRILMSLFVILAVLCLICGFLPKQVGGVDLTKAIVASALIGKMVNGTIMAYIFIYTSELFPTTARGGCMAVCGTAMRIGGTLAPQFVELRSYYTAIPYILVAAMMVLCSLFVIPFPETFGTRMPNTMQEALFKEELKVNDSQSESSGELQKLNE